MRLKRPQGFIYLAEPHHLLNKGAFPARWKNEFARSSSTEAPFAHKPSVPFRSQAEKKLVGHHSGLSRLPTYNILRSLALNTFLSVPILFKPGLALLSTISRSKSVFLHPDKNPVLRAIIKPLIYDQFCAGTNQQEIQAKVSQIKSLGFSGVVLCYGKENQIDKTMKIQPESYQTQEIPFDKELQCWKQGNLETLDMVGEGDWLGIKLSGAGACVTNRLLENEAAPKAFVEAMDAILGKASARNCRVWIDAEQQYLQDSIDRWTIDLMRRWNRGSRPVLYNTIQAYLKSSREKLAYQLQLAQQEDWTLAIKLVRGAYIENDIRTRIHDTKAQTDESYNSIVRDLLTEKVRNMPQQPRVQLFLAGHNKGSVTGAMSLINDLHNDGKLKVLPDFGQLQGMADQLGCELLQRCEDMAQAGGPMPKVYKCLTWGSVQECTHYLVRRAVENHGAASAVKNDIPALVEELKRRAFSLLVGRSRL